MFHLKNAAGNVHRYVRTEQAKERLLERGYTLVVEEKKPSKNSKRKAVADNDGN